jgi:hypothetical protein
MLLGLIEILYEQTRLTTHLAESETCLERPKSETPAYDMTNAQGPLPALSIDLMFFHHGRNSESHISVSLDKGNLTDTVPEMCHGGDCGGSGLRPQAFLAPLVCPVWSCAPAVLTVMLHSVLMRLLSL